MGLWEWVKTRWSGSNEDAGADESRFVASPLDRSVRIAHGGKEDEIERKLTEIHEQAREMDDELSDH